MQNAFGVSIKLKTTLKPITNVLLCNYIRYQIVD